MLAAFVNALPPAFTRGAVLVHAKLTKPHRARHTMSVAPIALSPTVDVHIVPILSDNFSYLLHDKSAGVAAAVDPAEPRKLAALASSLNAKLTTALVTHHHWDHAGGNEELAELIPGVTIVGSAYETAAAVTDRMETGSERRIDGSELSVTALRTPCHTMGHLCFRTNTPLPAVFSGDTLFVAGCGKFFEGDAADMDESLNRTLAGLPDETLVFCGHEYTVTNLLFAKSIDPTNARVAEKLEWAKRQVANGLHTVPSTIGDEKGSNPFMRTSQLAGSLGLSSAGSAQVMKALRERKNAFRP